MKWQILLKMLSYSIETQKMIIAACMTLHNYIRARTKEDIHFDCDRDPNYVPTIPELYKCYAVPMGASDSSTTEASGRDMDKIRDQLATAIALSWICKHMQMWYFCIIFLYKFIYMCVKDSGKYRIHQFQLNSQPQTVQNIVYSFPIQTRSEVKKENKMLTVGPNIQHKEPYVALIGSMPIIISWTGLVPPDGPEMAEMGWQPEVSQSRAGRTNFARSSRSGERFARGWERSAGF
jgi:hypothetical protein